MNKVMTALCATAMFGATAQAGVSVNVGMGDSSAPWAGFMNVFELDGTTPAFSSGWGVADLTASFDDGAGIVTMGAAPVDTADSFWYVDGMGGPGSAGNKVMEANMYQQSDDGSLSGVIVNFSGVVASNTFTQAHQATIFIRDFAPDFSSFTETSVAANAGAFSIDLLTDAGLGRHVQWGIQVKGVNVWSTDVADFGSLVVNTIPTPGSFTLLGLAGLTATRRRRA